MNKTFDLYVEQRLLSNIILDSRNWFKVAADFKAEFFTDPEYRAVAEAILAVTKNGKKPASGRIYNELRKQSVTLPGELLSSITEGHITYNETIDLLEQARDLYKRRTIYETLVNVLDDLRDKDISTEELMAEAQGAMIDAFQKTGSSELTTMHEVAAELFTEQQRIQAGEKPPIYSLSLYGVQKLLGGYEKGSLNIIAARPSMGKTSFMLNEALGWAQKGLPGIIFSLEQNRKQIGQRNIANLEQVPLSSLRYKLDENYLDKFNTGLSKISNLPIKISDKRGLTVEQICSLARVEKLRNPELTWITVDYLGVISVNPKIPHHLAVGDAVSKLRNLSEELDIFVVLLSQLNRGLETRYDKRPQKSDLRDSGNIEEFADSILFLYRESYYNPDFLNVPLANNIVEIEIAKNRQGGNDGLSVPVIFKPNQMLWESCPYDLITTYNSFTKSKYTKSKGA